MKRQLGGLIGLLVVLAGAPAIADMFAPSHICSRPWRGANGYNEFEVDGYRSCLKRFIDEQHGQAQAHMDAAEQAAGAWKRFVREANAGM